MCRRIQETIRSDIWDIQQGSVRIVWASRVDSWEGNKLGPYSIHQKGIIFIEERVLDTVLLFFRKWLRNYNEEG